MVSGSRTNRTQHLHKSSLRSPDLGPRRGLRGHIMYWCDYLKDDDDDDVMIASTSNRVFFSSSSRFSYGFAESLYKCLCCKTLLRRGATKRSPTLRRSTCAVIVCFVFSELQTESSMHFAQEALAVMDGQSEGHRGCVGGNAFKVGGSKGERFVQQQQQTQRWQMFASVGPNRIQCDCVEILSLSTALCHKPEQLNDLAQTLEG
eukprot:6485575-Amphidinium_carterae.1